MDFVFELLIYIQSDELVETKQPKRQKKKKTSIEHEEEEYIEKSKTQGVHSLSPEIKEKLISDIVRLFIFADSKKVPVRRDDINKKVIKNYKMKGIFNYLLEEAKVKLLDIFGFEVVQLPKTNVNGVVISSQTGNYILRRGKDLHEYMGPIRKYATDNFIQREKGILMLLLAIIYINNNRMEKEALLESFAPIHIVDLDLKVLLDKFRREMYLDSETIKDDHIPQTFYTLGSRALVEIGKANILRFIAHICDIEVDPIRLKELEQELLEDVQDVSS